MSLNAFDVIAIVAAVAAAIGGWRLGLITRALSWAGMTLGVVVAARIVPGAVGSAQGSRAEIFLIAVGLLLGGAFLGQAVGMILGNRVGLARRSGTAHRVDAAGGAVAGVLGVLVAVWLLVPAFADVPGWQSRQARTSEVARVVDHLFPDAPDATRTMRRLLGEQYPSVFDALRPTPALGRPPAASGLDRQTTARVVRSTVKILGEACNRIQEGSGFVVRPGLVITNAHVVAGVESSVIERSDGSRIAAHVVAFDPRADVAVLAAPSLNRAPLPVAEAAPGAKGAVFGHPGGGPLHLSPFQVGQRVEAVGRDIYGQDRTRRDVLILASSLAPGDSGAALVNAVGQVVGVAFAIAPDRSGVAYALGTSEVRTVLSTAGTTSVPTGSCVA